MDMSLPVFDGWDAARQRAACFRETAERPWTPHPGKLY
jgi:hypothetical protein